MNEREQALVRLVSDDLVLCGRQLIAKGWHPELIVFTEDEITRIPGYKVALVVPIDSVESAAEESQS